MIVKTPKKVVNEKWILSKPRDGLDMNFFRGKKDNSYSRLICQLSRKN